MLGFDVSEEHVGQEEWDMRTHRVLLHGNSRRSHSIISQEGSVAGPWGGVASAGRGGSGIVGGFL